MESTFCRTISVFVKKKEFLLQLLLLVITTRNHLKTVITGEVKTKTELKKWQDVVCVISLNCKRDTFIGFIFLVNVMLLHYSSRIFVTSV